MSRGYYFTAEPVGCCSCHDCVCRGCAECHEPQPESAGGAAAYTPPAVDPWALSPTNGGAS